MKDGMSAIGTKQTSRQPPVNVRDFGGKADIAIKELHIQCNSFYFLYTIRVLISKTALLSAPKRPNRRRIG